MPCKPNPSPKQENNSRENFPKLKNPFKSKWRFIVSIFFCKLKEIICPQTLIQKNEDIPFIAKIWKLNFVFGVENSNKKEVCKKLK